MDGDTVRLTDGRHIRVLGINTPELGHDGEPDHRYAKDARQAVEEFLGGNGQVSLVYDRQRVDRYHRHLAHVYRGDGANLESHLLSKGLAYPVAIPPNLSLAACLWRLAQEAERARIGVWGIAPVESRALRTGGYQRVRGRVVRVNFADAWWIELEGGVTGVIYPESQRYFSRSDVEGWVEKSLELRGWVYAANWRGKQQWRVKLHTPFAVKPAAN